MDDEVLKTIGIWAIALFIVFITILAMYGFRQLTVPEVNAKPVTTEIPEYTMKCTVFEDTCKEYTIYRITRN